MNKIIIVNLGVLFLLLQACQNGGEKPLFEKISVEQSGVDFNNVIANDDSLNILTYEYIYNGGGVAIADFDNDGLSDLFFTGNRVDNKLYKNQGDLKFEDVSETSKIKAPGFWCAGIAVIDINQDGFKDIYVSTNTHKLPNRRRNLLFINKMATSGKLVFDEMAIPYGIADTSYTTNSTFFDYDNDGDLDLFLINNNMQESRSPTIYSYQKNLSGTDRIDRLYRNDWSEEKGHAVFTDVSEAAGITFKGYSLGLNICDINQDGWKDIYVTNDFLSNDLLYINNQDGTFTNKAEDYLKHICLSAMGNDVVDINNDGLLDILAVDMLPESNYRKKTLMGPTNYTKYRFNKKYGYMQQYIRNVLQINQGTTPYSDDVVFSERSMLGGIDATDWSWAPVVADFDRDGLRDVIITNGFPKDITDRDFMDYQANYYAYVEKHKMLKKIPEVKIPNYAFRNQGEATFENVTQNWGLNIPSFSNGAACGDLDNDGDLDLVINNINDAAFIYENTISTGNYLKVELKGPKKNPQALGTILKYKTDQINGYYEHNLSRGYLSSIEEKIFLGLGKDSIVDLTIIWPDGMISNQKIKNVNKLLNFDYEKIQKNKAIAISPPSAPLFSPSEIVSDQKIPDADYIDYDHEPLLLHKFSQFGPGIAVGDANGDQLDDYYVVGSNRKRGQLFLQTKSGDFEKMDTSFPIDTAREELSALFFDVDQDGDQDLYIACGGNQFPKNDRHYKDQLLINENGQFTNVSDQINFPNSSSSCVRIADMDQDGDLDLFVAGRVLPGEYPLPVSSYLIKNNSTASKISLEIVNDQAAKDLNDIGLVCDALWTDYDEDGWMDLLIAGEWMPITIFKNEKGQLKKINAGLENFTGWWNSIASADFDNDGDMDYVVTNFGENSNLRISQDQPMKIYAKDFDDNGSLDAIPLIYLKNRKGEPQQFTFHGRGDLAKELNRIKKMFTSHHKIGIAPIDSILSEKDLTDAYTLNATTFKSSYIENLGNGQFKLVALPLEAQTAPGYGIIANDFDEDGNFDILMVGNDHGVQPTLGQMDAMNGLFLKGDGKGGFTSSSLQNSGFYVPGNAKAMTNIFVGNQPSIVVSQNNDQLLAFKYGSEGTFFTPESNDTKLTFLDNSEKLLSTQELYYGNGFLSQSSRKIKIPPQAKKVIVRNHQGQKRTIEINQNEVLN